MVVISDMAFRRPSLALVTVLVVVYSWCLVAVSALRWCRWFGFWCFGSGVVQVMGLYYSQVMGLTNLCYFTALHYCCFAFFLTTPKFGCGSAVAPFIFPIPFKKTTAESQPFSKTFFRRDFSSLRRSFSVLFLEFGCDCSEFGFGVPTWALMVFGVRAPIWASVD
jgi:hypothetical protein